MAANLKDFVLSNCEGKEINYVSAHDNETLFDIVSLKTSKDVSVDERCRINHLATSIIALSQPGNDIDVYLAPLIDDLKLLWEVGVEVYDAYKKETFNLRAILMWTINDFPAYGNLSGCCVKGYKACPVCGDDTHSIRLKRGGKNIYLGHRRFLPMEHQYRKQKRGFLGKPEYGEKPIPLSGEEVVME